MKCPLCSNNVGVEYMYDLYVPSTKDSTDISMKKVCYTCFILTSILETLREIREWHLRDI